MTTIAIIIGSRTVLRDDAVAALGQALDALPQHVMQHRRVPLGIYRGLRFGMVLHPQWSPEVYLEGAATRQDQLSREHHGPRAVLNAVERLAGGYGSECDRIRQDLGIAEAQLRDYQARLGKPFPHDAYLAELTALRDQLKAGLSGAAPEPGSEPEPSVAELAEQIKALQGSKHRRGHARARRPDGVPSRGARHRPHPPQNRISYVQPRHGTRCRRTVTGDIPAERSRLPYDSRNAFSRYQSTRRWSPTHEMAYQELLRGGGDGRLLFPFLRLCGMPRFAFAKLVLPCCVILHLKEYQNDRPSNKAMPSAS